MVLISRRRAGFIFRDLAIAAILASLSISVLLPAALQEKKKDAIAQCKNNLRQLTIATHNCFDHHEGARMPPMAGDYMDEKAHGTLFYHILPYLEQANLYKSGEGEKEHFSGWNNAVYGKVVKLFLCPADASGGAEQLYEGWLALGNYAGNFQAFGDALANTMEGNGRFPATFTDGTSNTIIYAERYQMCNGVPNAWGFAGASTWTPTFAYLSTGKFQEQPAQKDCDPTVPQTIHADGMHVGMADGSVHTVSLRISPQTWWYAITPNGGEVLGPDW